MSLEDLQADLAANMAEAKNLSALSSIGDIANHLNNTLWPFVQNVVAEQAEMDTALRDMYENSEDILQYETGKQLATTIGGAMTLVNELEARAGGDARLLAAIKEWRAHAKESSELLEDITLPDADDDVVEDDQDGDDDVGDDGDDDETGGVQ